MKDWVARKAKGLRGLIHEPSRDWFKRFAQYHHGMTWQEFWVNYTFARQCFNDVVKTDGEHDAFYTDWPLYRQAWRNRNRTWYNVLGHMSKEVGHPPGRPARLLDYGCGNGDMLVWLNRRRPDWWYYGVDLLDTPHARYAQDQMDRDGVVGRLYPPGGETHFFDVIVCTETLEHLPNPMDTVIGLQRLLVHGGVLIWDYINDGQGKDRDLTVWACLNSSPKTTRGVYVRP